MGDGTGGYLLAARLGRLTVDDAFRSRRKIVPHRNGDTSYISALMTFFPYITREPFIVLFGRKYVIRACLSTSFFDRDGAVENKNSYLTGRDFNFRHHKLRSSKSRPIGLKFPLSIAYFRSRDDVPRHALSAEMFEFFIVMFGRNVMSAKMLESSLRSRNVIHRGDKTKAQTQ